MNYLSIILSFKIVITLVSIVLPFMLYHRSKLDRLMDMTSTSAILYRLYGVAVLSLLVAYSSGIYSATAGIFPWGVVFMGLVSNVGASSTLIILGSWKDYKFLTLFFGLIGALLTWVALNPELAMRSPF